MALDLFLILSASITYGASLIFPSLGEDFTELAGVYNIGTEGIMLTATATTFAGAIYTGSPYIGLLIGILSGALIGLFLAIFSVHLKADQVIFGLGIILLGGFLGPVIVDAIILQVNRLQVNLIPTLNTAGLAYPLNILLKQNYLTFVALALAVVMWLLFFKTRFGLAARAVGENPNVAASSGINVVLIRYICSIVGCAIAAIGGSFVLIGLSGIWSNNMTAGRGFVAIAVVRIGFFRPLLILIFSLVFGFVDSLQLALQVSSSGFPLQVLQMAPYLVGLAALIISSRFKAVKEPASIGKPYNREQR